MTLQATIGASDDETVERLLEVIDTAASTRATMEAHLALAFAYDQRQDLVAAEQTLLQVCDSAKNDRLSYYRAAALGALGWNRTRAGDHLEAEGYLQAAIELSTKIGADGVVADAKGGLAHRHYSEHRAGSALRCIEEAAQRCCELGRVGSEQRWRRAACTIAHSIGDVPSIRRHFTRLQEIVGRSDSTSLQLAFTLADIQAILHEYEGRPERALAIHQDLLDRATSSGAHFLAYCSRIEILRQELVLGNNAAALTAARGLVDYADASELPPPLVTTATGYLGVALIANGDPAGGIEHLRKVVGASQAGLPALPSHLSAFYEAATDLGLDDEARAIAVKATRYLTAFRSDLTEDQWRTATRRKPELGRLVDLLPDFDREVV